MTARGLILTLCLVASAASAGEYKTAVVAARDLPAGTVLKLDDLSQRGIPVELLTDSTVAPEEAGLFIGQKLIRPLATNELLEFTALLTWPRPGEVEGCKKALARVPKPLALPVRSLAKNAETVTVVVARRKILPGEELVAEALESRELHVSVANDHFVRFDEMKLLPKQVALNVLREGDPVRFTVLSGWANRSRCDWLEQAARARAADGGRAPAP